MQLLHLCLAIGLALSPSLARADATIPAQDIPGAKDSPVLKRYAGSFIVSYDRVAYTDFRLPLSKLELTTERDLANNRAFRPKEAKAVEGARTRLAYLLPAERSPLEVLRNYQDEVEAGGGTVLFACKEEGCGGDHRRSSSGGGSDSSLLMYFLHARDLKDAPFSNGSCALTTAITGQRFLSARMPHPDGEAHLTVHTYQVVDGQSCKAFNGRTIALVHLVEPRPRERRMTTVKAEEMAQAIGASGRIALYGILFDTDRTEVKPESGATLEQIAGLLRTDPKLSVIVVGHTDNQGAYEYNLDLSRRRAEAVIKALATTHKVDPKRLKAAGVGMAAPTASNDAEDGRAKNRRVELVKLN